MLLKVIFLLGFLGLLGAMVFDHFTGRRVTRKVLGLVFSLLIIFGLLSHFH